MKKGRRSHACYMYTAVIGDCSVCKLESCFNHKDFGGSGINPIIKDGEPISAYLKIFSGYEKNYKDVETHYCTSRPIAFSEPPHVIAMHGIPQPREIVILLSTSDFDHPINSGIILRVAQLETGYMYEKFVRSDINNLDVG